MFRPGFSRALLAEAFQKSDGATFEVVRIRRTHVTQTGKALQCRLQRTAVRVQDIHRQLWRPHAHAGLGPTVGVYAQAFARAAAKKPVLFYLFFLDQPFLRSTGLPAVVLMLVGLAVGLWAIRGDRRLRIRILGGLKLLLAVLVVIYFWYGMVLPAGSPLATGEAAPDFTLANHTGEQVTLSQTLSAGPVLLLFYRGYW